MMVGAQFICLTYNRRDKMEIIEVTKEEFEIIINSKEKVLVDFYADWCGPCKMLRPVLEEIAKEKEDIKIVSINVDQEETLAREYHVFSIPCLVLINNGKEEKRTVGFQEKEKLLDFIDK